MAQTLRDWYRYLERQMRVSLPEEPTTAAAGQGARPAAFSPHAAELPPPAPPQSQARHDPRSSESRNGARPQSSSNGLAEAAPRRDGAMLENLNVSPLDDGRETVRRRGGRRPLTESREQIIRRLLDPEVSLHEAAAVLSLSKATIRRYTDQGKLACLRTTGGQRRFRFSVLLSFLDHQSARRGEG
jgi:excisionase family DNA binding protein